MEIQRAVREQTYTLTSIAGPSGSGKTYSALLYARGLVGEDGKIGFIDTENRRSRFYADVAGGFDVIDLDPPFTAQRYIEAIKAFEKAGYSAIVVDSVSHEWEGTGGVLEQAEAIEQATKKAGLHCWQRPKAGHKKMMNELLQTRAHLIFCCRVKEKVVQVKRNGKTEIVNEGFVVVQEKMFIYEMTVSMMLSEGTHVPTVQKCPGDLIKAFPSGQKINPEAGACVRAWSEQGRAIDSDLEDAKREGLAAANEGLMALQKWWTGLGPRQSQLEGMKETFKSIARAADQIMSDIHDAGGGDPGERLAHAKANSGSLNSDEGFDSDHVRQSTNAAQRTLESSKQTHEPSTDAAQAPQSADAGSQEASPPASAPDNSESAEAGSEPESSAEEKQPDGPDAALDSAPEGALKLSLVECVQKCMQLATDPDLDAGKRRNELEKANPPWKKELPRNLDQVRVIFQTADRVIKKDLDLNTAKEYLAGVLKLDVGELG